MENPQPAENRTITTIDAVNLLYYAAIGVAPQSERAKDSLRNAIINELHSLVQEREDLRKQLDSLTPPPPPTGNSTTLDVEPPIYDGLTKQLEHVQV